LIKTHQAFVHVQWFGMVFYLGLAVGGCVTMAGTVFLHDEPQPAWASALYAGLDRMLMAVCFNTFMFGCFMDYKCKLLLLVFNFRFQLL
jgi:hypothetical protein